MVTNLATSSATSYNSEISMLSNLQIIISTLLTCQSVFMTKFSNLGTATNAEKKCNSKTT